jgi:hypothetical protein
MFFVIKSVKDHADVEAFGPYSSIEKARQSCTDVTDSDACDSETQYTIFEYNSYVNRVGYDSIKEVSIC